MALLVSGFLLAATLCTFAPPEGPGRIEPTPHDLPWGGPAPETQEPETTEPEDPEAKPPPPESGPASDTEANEPEATKIEPAREPADPGDARPTAPPNPDPLLEAKGPIGPKKMIASVAVYGMVVTNAVYDTGSVGPTDDSPVFALPGSMIGEGLASDGVFLITARQSRLGVRSTVQLSERLDMLGMIEIDFMGLHENAGPAGVIQPGLRLRLAKLEFGSANHRFIAGQDWAVVTPRLPTSLSHMVVAAHSFGGAVWSRIPQLTYSMRAPISSERLSDARFGLQVSAARNFSGDGFGGPATRFDVPDPGTSSQLPMGMMRIAFESEPFSIGAGGLIGRETFQVARLESGSVITVDDHVLTWMATGDIQATTKWVWLAGQGYYGSNINGMLSNQGIRRDTWTTADVDPADPRLGLDRDIVALHGGGGWAEIGALLGTEKVKLFASGGADVGVRERTAEGGRWLNIGILGGLIYAPFPVFDMSVEYQRIQSYYRRANPNAPLPERLGVNDFVALSFRFKF